MRIIFVRHGEPDYVRDCLTETGKAQAAAAAERLAREGIAEIYASPLGRARETAEYAARRLGLPVTELDYMREISWGGAGIPEKGHPWTLADWMIERDGFDFRGGDWRRHPYFRENACTRYYDEIADKFDGFLAGRGYRHEGTRFLCDGGGEETIALFSHGGSGACALAHTLAMPFPWVLSVMPYDYTSLIIVELPARQGEYVRARLELFNDAAHIHRDGGGPRIQMQRD